MTEFRFHREPNEHQRAAFEESKDYEYYALFWEQRCRKTKVVIDTATYNYLKGVVNALVVIAGENGVQYVWVEEVKKDVQPDVPRRIVAWQSGRMETRDAKRDLEELLTFRGLSVLSMAATALKTKQGWTYLETFLKNRRALVCGDEASFAANWTAQTRKFLAVGRRHGAVMRRICEGTPVDEGPIDVFYPAQFLSPHIFGTQIEGFRARYSQYEEEETLDEKTGQMILRRKTFFNGKTGSSYEKFVGWRNLDDLHERMSGWSSRLLRSQLSNAPGPTYRSVYFELSTQQRKVYDKLRDEYLMELRDGERTVERVLTRMIRLQMIARNYYPPETIGEPCPACQPLGTPGFDADGVECENCDGLSIVVRRTEMERIDPNVNPALDALGAELKTITGPVVVWSIFRQDTADAVAALEATGRRVARYDGTIPQLQRNAYYDGFRSGEYDAIACGLMSGIIRGHDLTRAESAIFYSNSYSLRRRRQAQDRTESLDRTISTGVTDLIAANTRDVDNINALREKRLTSDRILQDPPETWI